MNERILVVDDEKAIADLVGIYLTKEGFDVQIAYSGADAAKAILEQEFDLALLDVMLPDIDGFELLRTIRSSHTYPVIMLTARDELQRTERLNHVIVRTKRKALDLVLLGIARRQHDHRIGMAGTDRTQQHKSIDIGQHDICSAKSNSCSKIALAASAPL